MTVWLCGMLSGTDGCTFDVVRRLLRTDVWNEVFKWMLLCVNSVNRAVQHIHMEHDHEVGAFYMEVP